MFAVIYKMHADEFVASWWFSCHTSVFKSAVVMKLGKFSIFSILPNGVAIGSVKSTSFCCVARNLDTKFVDGAMSDRLHTCLLQHSLVDFGSASNALELFPAISVE